MIRRLSIWAFCVTQNQVGIVAYPVLVGPNHAARPTWEPPKKPAHGLTPLQRSDSLGSITVYCPSICPPSGSSHYCEHGKRAMARWRMGTLVPHKNGALGALGAKGPLLRGVPSLHQQLVPFAKDSYPCSLRKTWKLSASVDQSFHLCLPSKTRA